ncbi:hypothetical protein [Rossellomorea sp. NPDC077527]|uniref:hypothetical protein n=1 Tax=Rossellomorea sp. NPDC077527 TaxID=3364510 RepID=UPI0037C93700
MLENKKEVANILNLKKKLLYILAFFLFLIFLSGCQQETYYYKGEGDYWEGSYTSNQTSDRENGEFVFGYKGEGEGDVGEIVYEITSNTGDHDGNRYVYGRTFTTTTACSGCAKPNEDDEFKVVIKWGGKKDEFTLKRN